MNLSEQSGKHAQDWIVILAEGLFLKHPRGEQSRFRAHAYGYYYKKSARQISFSYPGAKVEKRGKV